MDREMTDLSKTMSELTAHLSGQLRPLPEAGTVPMRLSPCIYLLACMLARAWNPKEATSIWVELVKERQKEIEASIDNEPRFISTCMAACQKISRKQLAMWDASARSWLRSADEAMSTDRTKLMLILKNISLNISEGNSTYTKVIDAWRN